jgi:hypothetical protein
VYVLNGTNDSDGSKVRVVDDVSDHEPPTEGVIFGIGLPAARGWVRLNVIGPAGDTPCWPDVGELDEIASACAGSVLEVPDVPPPPPPEDPAFVL